MPSKNVEKFGSRDLNRRGFLERFNANPERYVGRFVWLFVILAIIVTIAIMVIGVTVAVNVELDWSKDKPLMMKFYETQCESGFDLGSRECTNYFLWKQNYDRQKDNQPTHN